MNKHDRVEKPKGFKPMTQPETIYVSSHYPMYRVWQTVGGYVVVYIIDRNNFRSVDGGKVHRSRQNAYAKAKRLNDAMIANVHEAEQALKEDKVVLADFAGRRVTVNALSEGVNGWIMKWSHRDYPEAQIDDIDADATFIIRGEYSRYR